MAEAWTPNRQEAWALLRQYTKDEQLLKHALAVEAAMRAYAAKYGEDAERWAVTGLLHDMDYEQHPTLEEHPKVGAEILRSLHYPEDIVEAVLSHGNHLGVPRRTLMAKALYAVDELTGFVAAVALVRPSKKVADVQVSSVKKKMKDKSFAKGCNREEMLAGAAELGVPFDEHVALVIAAMSGIADELGL
ncbi:MAG TPA: HDIG domain-containing protein [Firmicutes bacterium]|nr:HDIG domain-containing protein [Bacillota bacterium]